MRRSKPNSAPPKTPLPSCPWKLLPMAQRAPLSVTNKLWSLPAAASVTPAFHTITGIAWSALELMPSWPILLRPTAQREPSVLMIKVWLEPETTLFTSLRTVNSSPSGSVMEKVPTTVPEGWFSGRILLSSAMSTGVSLPLRMLITIGNCAESPAWSTTPMIRSRASWDSKSNGSLA